MTPREAATLLGKLGGAAGRGAAKRRTREHYQRAARLALKRRPCPHCGREILGNLGLFAHLRKHASEGAPTRKEPDNGTV